MQAGQKILVLAAMTAALIGCTKPQTAAPEPAPPLTKLTAEDEAAIREFGRKAIEEDGHVGITIAVAKGGQIVFAEGFGHADVKRTIPVDKDTIFDIASVGKQYTAVAILKLADEGKLNLDQKVREFVPELPAHFPNATIRQLLSMTSGFVSGDLPEQEPPEDYKRKRYGLELLTDHALQTGKAKFKPGETFVYSNAGYLVLGLVVEAASGKRYDNYIREELLVPNGMSDVLVTERAEPPRMSQAIQRDEDEYSEVAFIDMTAYGGQGSICSSVVDLLNWNQALSSGKLISAQALQAMRAGAPVRVSGEPQIVPYGYAQRVSEFFGHQKVGHTGTFDGGSAALYEYPDDDLAIAVISNTSGSGTPHAFRYEQMVAGHLLKAEIPDVKAMAVPYEDGEKESIAGDYSMDRGVFTAKFDGDTLVVLNDGEEEGRLVHVGYLTFRDPDKPDVTERFLLDGDKAGWWVYDISGSYIDVLRRLPSP